MTIQYTHNSIIVAYIEQWQSSIPTTLSQQLKQDNDNPVYPQHYHSSLHRTMAIQYTHNSIIVAYIEQWQSSIPTTLSYMQQFTQNNGNPVYPQLYHSSLHRTMVIQYTHNSIIHVVAYIEQWQSSIPTTLSQQLTQNNGNPVYPQLYHSSLHRTMAIQYTHNSIIVAYIEQWQSSIPTTLSQQLTQNNGNPVYPQLYHSSLHRTMAIQYTHNSILQSSIPTTLSQQLTQNNGNPVYLQLYHSSLHRTMTIQYTHNSIIVAYKEQ